MKNYRKYKVTLVGYNDEVAKNRKINRFPSSISRLNRMQLLSLIVAIAGMAVLLYGFFV